MKNLGCTMCILAFSSFSSLTSALKDEKARTHIVHPSFFILHLTPHTSHLTPHIYTSHLTPHTSHLTSAASQEETPASQEETPASQEKEKLQPARMQFQPVGKNLGDGTQDAHCASWFFLILQSLIRGRPAHEPPQRENSKKKLYIE